MGSKRYRQNGEREDLLDQNTGSHARVPLRENAHQRGEANAGCLRVGIPGELAWEAYCADSNQPIASSIGFVDAVDCLDYGVNRAARKLVYTPDQRRFRRPCQCLGWRPFQPRDERIGSPPGA